MRHVCSLLVRRRTRRTRALHLATTSMRIQLGILHFPSSCLSLSPGTAPCGTATNDRISLLGRDLTYFFVAERRAEDARLSGRHSARPRQGREGAARYSARSIRAAGLKIAVKRMPLGPSATRCAKSSLGKTTKSYRTASSYVSDHTSRDCPREATRGCLLAATIDIAAYAPISPHTHPYEGTDEHFTILTARCPSRKNCNCFAARSAARYVSQVYHLFLAPTGLRVSQFSVLAKLKHRGPDDQCACGSHGDGSHDGRACNPAARAGWAD
jgi:hypothetical protein